ncbi:Acg family FMN-binding oxidoreductase [Nocardioides sp. NPDC057772]|uniref:Acg family FMN-binding oxidoreductase n=1 Tax=Nocardioides sp. NPDC057772 TaxID=3346245 RepID=UPI003671D98F
MSTLPDEPTLRAILELASRAPSVHNTQPWAWAVRDQMLLLRADPHRKLLHADPNERDLVMSCGAALHELVVAAAGTGWACTVHRTPEGGRTDLLAVVTFAPREPDAVDLGRLAAIEQRHTDRRLVSSWPVPRERLEHLAELVRDHAVVATTVPDHLRPVVLSALETARAHQSTDEAYLAELYSWTRGGTEDGIPESSLLAAGSDPSSYSRFPAGTLADDYDDAGPSAEEWLVLATASDDPLSWLRTGEALDAIWLSCTTSGLALVPYTQPIEIGSTRRTLQHDLLGDNSCPQVLVRIGWPQRLRPPLPPTPRRAVDDILHHESAASS